MRFASGGVAVDLPAGWDARIIRRQPLGGATTGTVLHAGNFPLPEDRGDYGSGAVERMGPGHVLVVLFEHGEDAAGTPLFAAQGPPRGLDASLFARNSLQRKVGGQAGAQWFFTEAGRAFCLYVVLGSFRHRRALTALAGTVTATIAVDPLPAPAGPRFRP